MKQRLLSAIIAIIVSIPIVIYGGLPFTLFIYILGSIALFEMLRMKKIKLLTFPGITSLILLYMIIFPKGYINILYQFILYKGEAILLVTLLLLSYTVFSKNKFTFENAGFVLLSSIFLGYGFHYAIEVRSEGLVYIIFALFTIWASDSGAYFIGRAIGKRKLAPHISPNKTIEGALGGIILSVIVATIFSIVIDVSLQLPFLMIVTVVISIFGQLGDLVESALKRHFVVKDSGRIMPGHGGVLDRFDSLLFVLPIFYMLLSYFSN
ncbi:phosphatidate cytidylyltransferase [Bacillus carboniphilus]|uniref:Phosphatidate cytidylyltransferase n=1 Tax=Bacillus carboniphilus TaxID=86663 RepID=A0ABY9JVT4_9BACI|nr:phosphatidate cytidylyltransferase [Bacillus carboniphilus]WLR43512.1 phosphatidate cytidylyltransferase [Bacillus carboniphilus]